MASLTLENDKGETYTFTVTGTDVTRVYTTGTCEHTYRAVCPNEYQAAQFLIAEMNRLNRPEFVGGSDPMRG